jgi:hypothetical protein
MEKRKILATLLSIILPLFIVGAVVWAASTIGNNVSVGGTLTVTSTSTFNGGVILGNAAGDKVSVIGQLDTALIMAATTTTYGLDLNAATLTTDLRLSNGGTIHNTNANTITITESKVVISGDQLGVGTTTPGTILDVASSTATSTIRVGSYGQPGCIVLWSTTTDSYVYLVASNAGIATTSAATCGL